MRIEIQTNRTPIIAGDEIGIVIHPSGVDYLTMWYSLELLAPPRTLAGVIGPFNPHYDWTVDAIGNGLVVKAIAHAGFGLVSTSALSNPFTVIPDAPKVSAPVSDELMSAGSAYTFRWDINPPHPDTNRVLFSTDGGGHFQQLGADVPGNAHSASRHVPSTPTDQGRVRVEGIFAGFPPSFFDGVNVRTTASPVVRVSRPGAGTIWHLGDEATIAWDAHGEVSHFVVRFSRDGGHSWTTLSSNVDGAERQISVPVDPPASENCKVRVEAVGPTGSESDDSDGFFRIRPPH